MSVAIIWMWAAGMMCAACLIENKYPGKIFLFDKNNEIGKKVAITWGGRCNVTTGLRSNKDIMSNYVRGALFLKFAMRKFWPVKVIKWFEDHNVALKVEKDMRVFPVSNKSEDIILIFEKILTASDSVYLCLDTPVLNIIKDVKNSITNFVVSTSISTYCFDEIVITTWWNVYQKTGSSWDAYTWARSFWHTITKLWPSLNSFLVRESWVKSLQGISLPNAKIIFIINWKLKKVSWSLLFTHRWLSGPLAFKLSSYIAYQEISSSSLFSVTIQFDSEKDFEYWNKKILTYISQYPKRQVSKMLWSFFSKKIVDVLLDFVRPSLKKLECFSLAKEDRKKICHFFSWVNIDLLGRKIGDEFVTAWWIKTEEVNNKTMESNFCDNLFFAGEILDIDGFTWWFNLQAAWCTWKMVANELLKRS